VPSAAVPQSFTLGRGIPRTCGTGSPPPAAARERHADRPSDDPLRTGWCRIRAHPVLVLHPRVAPCTPPLGPTSSPNTSMRDWRELDIDARRSRQHVDARGFRLRRQHEAANTCPSERARPAAARVRAVGPFRENMARQLLRVRLGSRQRSVQSPARPHAALARQASPFPTQPSRQGQKLTQVGQRIRARSSFEDLRRLVGCVSCPE